MDTLTHTITSSQAPFVHGNPTLDATIERLEDGDITFGMNDLFDDLLARRKDESGAWPQVARECLEHPIRELLHQDPFTYRAFAKPRGYAGDAVMMDYIYGLGETRDAARHATPLGRTIFRYMDTRPSARAVRYRRCLIADLIDRVAEPGEARVFALASGHLREADISIALRQGKVQEFVALDQDRASLAVVERDYARLGVKAVEGSVRQILSGKAKPGQFDFVYAAGLFDYLSQPVAAALTSRMFEMTRPGGVMLIPNFLGSVRDRGYMESFMDWRLIYRDHADMRALAAALPASDVAESRIFDDGDKAITFLLVAKTGGRPGSAEIVSDVLSQRR
jgi:hypothetical protein